MGRRNCEQRTTGFSLPSAVICEGERDDAVVVKAGRRVIGEPTPGGNFIFVALHFIGEHFPFFGPANFLLFDGNNQTLDEFGL